MTDLSIIESNNSGSAPVVSNDPTGSNASISAPVVSSDSTVTNVSNESSSTVSTVSNVIAQEPASNASVVEQGSVPSVVPAIASMTLDPAETSEITSVPAPNSNQTKTTVKTVTSITKPVITATIQEGEGEETTDGEGTIDKFFEEFVETPAVEVHHAQDSQVMGDANASSVMDLNWEASLTASEWDDDHLVTPAQRVTTESRSQPEQTEELCTIEIQDGMECDNQAVKRKAIGSSDEESSIVMQFGSFVNSLLSGERKESKEKKETKKVKMEEIQNM